MQMWVLLLRSWGYAAHALPSGCRLPALGTRCPLLRRDPFGVLGQTPHTHGQQEGLQGQSWFLDSHPNEAEAKVTPSAFGGLGVF